MSLSPDRYIGLCAASGSLVTGTELVLGAVRSGKAHAVLLSSDASERTAKQVCDKCSYYKVPLVRLDSDMYGLAHITGKKAPVAAAAVTNKSLAQEIVKCAAN